jgi:hypothetical protein
LYTALSIQPAFAVSKPTSNQSLQFTLTAKVDEGSQKFTFTTGVNKPKVMVEFFQKKFDSSGGSRFIMPMTETSQLSGYVIEQKFKSGRPCKPFTSLIIKHKEDKIYKVELQKPTEWNLKSIQSESSKVDDELNPFDTIKKIENGNNLKQPHYFFFNANKDIVAKLELRLNNSQLIMLTQESSVHPYIFLVATFIEYHERIAIQASLSKDLSRSSLFFIKLFWSPKIITQLIQIANTLLSQSLKRFYNLINTKEECSICLEEGNDTKGKLLCGHEFHPECIERWIRTARKKGTPPRCPLCREPIKPVIPL